MSEPIIARRAPAVVEVEAGRTYQWCACGRSKNQPFCDGSHEGSGLAPLEFKAVRSEFVYFCCCKQAKTAPICDGTHNKI